MTKAETIKVTYSSSDIERILADYAIQSAGCHWPGKDIKSEWRVTSVPVTPGEITITITKDASE